MGTQAMSLIGQVKPTCVPPEQLNAGYRLQRGDRFSYGRSGHAYHRRRGADLPGLRHRDEVADLPQRHRPGKMLAGAARGNERRSAAAHDEKLHMTA